MLKNPFLSPCALLIARKSALLNATPHGAFTFLTFWVFEADCPAGFVAGDPSPVAEHEPAIYKLNATYTQYRHHRPRRSRQDDAGGLFAQAVRDVPR